MVTTFQGREGEHSGKRLPLASEWKLGKGGYPRDSLREFGRSVPGHVGVEREGDATSPWGGSLFVEIYGETVDKPVDKSRARTGPAHSFPAADARSAAHWGCVHFEPLALDCHPFGCSRLFSPRSGPIAKALRLITLRGSRQRLCRRSVCALNENAAPTQATLLV